MSLSFDMVGMHLLKIPAVNSMTFSSLHFLRDMGNIYAETRTSKLVEEYKYRVFRVDYATHLYQ